MMIMVHPKALISPLAPNAGIPVALVELIQALHGGHPF
jgi:hypothetical protein